jgi:hypothetical protein
MESRAFLEAFAAIPRPLARHLEARLDRSNARHREAADRRYIALYRRAADAMRGAIDLAVFGHIHTATDDPGPPRMIVLGGWHHRASYLRIDGEGAMFVIEPERAGSDTAPGPGIGGAIDIKDCGVKSTVP